MMEDEKKSQFLDAADVTNSGLSLSAYLLSKYPQDKAIQILTQALKECNLPQASTNNSSSVALSSSSPPSSVLVVASSLSSTAATAAVSLPKDIILILNQISCFSPRGKFDFVFCLNALHLLSRSASSGLRVVIPYSNISFLLKMPKQQPVNPKIVASYSYVICFDSPVQFSGKTKARYLAMTLPANESKTHEIKVMHKKNEETWDGPIVEHVDKALSKFVLGKKVIRTFPEISNPSFASTKAQPYIKCYMKTANGNLYLLPEGLFFMSPVEFIPRQKIQAIECGRGGSAASRTFDLNIDVGEKQQKQFTMIEREELPAISEYCNFLGKLISKDIDCKENSLTNDDVEELETEKTKPAVDASDDDDDEEDESFEVDIEAVDSGESEDLSGSAASSTSDNNSDDDSDDDQNDIADSDTKNTHNEKTKTETETTSANSSETESENGDNNNAPSKTMNHKRKLNQESDSDSDSGSDSC